MNRQPTDPDIPNIDFADADWSSLYDPPRIDPTISQDHTGKYAEREKDLLRSDPLVHLSGSTSVESTQPQHPLGGMFTQKNLGTQIPDSVGEFRRNTRSPDGQLQMMRPPQHIFDGVVVEKKLGTQIPNSTGEFWRYARSPIRPPLMIRPPTSTSQRGKQQWPPPLAHSAKDDEMRLQTTGQEAPMMFNSARSPRGEPQMKKRKVQQTPIIDFPIVEPTCSPVVGFTHGSNSDRLEQEAHETDIMSAPEEAACILGGQAITRPGRLNLQSEPHIPYPRWIQEDSKSSNNSVNIQKQSHQDRTTICSTIRENFQGSSLENSPNKESAGLFHDNPGLQPIIGNLLREVEALKEENSFLQLHLSTEARKRKRSTSSRWILIHRLDSTSYFDEPQWKQIQNGSWDLESRKPIPNFEVFLEKQKLGGVAFVVTLQYDRHNTRHGSYSAEPHEDGDFDDPPQRTTQQPIQTTVRPIHVSIRFLCEVLSSAWSHLLDMDEKLKQVHDDECEAKTRGCRATAVHRGSFDSEESFVYRNSLERLEHLEHQDLPNAEVFFYHFHSLIREKITAMEASNEKWQLNQLIHFVEVFFRDEYQEVNDLLNEGLVSGNYIKYLSAPGTVLISHENGNDIGYLQKTFFRDTTITNRSVQLMNLVFDGKFKMREQEIMIDVRDFKHTPRTIASLEYCPLQYADPQTVRKLKDRGHKFWRCRNSAYITYRGLDMNQETTYSDTRFLVDARTYHTMHGSLSNTSSRLSQLDDTIISRDEPPDDGSFVYIVPASIYGFEMQEKKWVDLQVDNIRQLEWNTEAFESLAVDEESKELINALVNNKIAAEKATDMVRGKGNGLIILLHGGPGTGKTLTAESVAEIAKKPLYRVTCGDIGTEPREVEKYLQKVFHLGKIWDCVVLLDEADVFLEQRTLSDLSRNALVSVFLRTLEYYDGILILTSNRVGTFDEAFKSRIQLALHYPNLDLAQRKQIWKNFTHRLDSLEEVVDTDAILASINKLAKYEMNGRQIRNAITTARQLALFKKETLTTKHLEHSIRVSGKFDQYLEEVHDQIKDDEMARQSGFR